jgi:hypothetical protein
MNFFMASMQSEDKKKERKEKKFQVKSHWTTIRVPPIEEEDAKINQKM